MQESTLEASEKQLEILYLGNKQGEFGAVISYMEFIIPYFEQFATVHSASGKKNYFFRLFDWVLHIIGKGKRADWILIDVFSGKQFLGVFVIVFFIRLIGLKYSCVLRGGNLPQRLQQDPKLSAFIFKNADHLIAPSQFLTSAFKKHGYSCSIIPNAVGNENFNENIEIRNPSPRLLCVRGIREVYNPLLAVKILKELKLDHPDAYLCMTGTKEDVLLQEVLDFVNANDLADSFEYLGVLTKAKWFDLAKSYSIYLSTTNFDNTPVSMIEAMNLGLLIVSTNVGGVPYLVEDETTALLYQKGDHFEAVNKIRKVLETPEVYTSLVNSSFEHGKLFRIEHVINSWIQFLTRKSF